MQQLGLHFAKSERAAYVKASEVRTVALPPVNGVLSPVPELSLPSLAQAFGRLARRKACGASGIPAEALATLPVEAAGCFAGLLLKVQLRGQSPALWRGGIVAPIPKPNKCPSDLAAWRSILLLEASAKGVARALRPCLLRSFEKLRVEGQRGSRPRIPIQIPMATCRGFFRTLRHCAQPGGLLFIDGQAAFYSTLRQLLTGATGLEDAGCLEQLAEVCFTTEQEKTRFIAQATAPGLLQCTDTPESVRRVLISSFEGSWYAVGSDRQAIFQTKTGTLPGAPLADLTFQIIFSQALQGMQDRLLELGLAAQLELSAKVSFRMPAPTWMDDLAVPLVVPEAAAVVPTAAKVVEVVAQELASIGIQINMGAGKSELVPFFIGPQSRLEKNRWLCSENASFPVQLTGERTGRMTIAPTYVHLGAVIDARAGDLEDVRRRRILAREMMTSQLKILRNPFLHFEEKRQIFLAAPMARFQHGAGLWALERASEADAYHAAYMELVRRACRPLTAVSSRGLSDVEVCCAVGVLTSSEARVAALCRHTAWLCAEPCQAVSEMWLTSGQWQTNAHMMLYRPAHTLQDSLVRLPGRHACEIPRGPSDGPVPILSGVFNKSARQLVRSFSGNGPASNGHARKVGFSFMLIRPG